MSSEAKRQVIRGWLPRSQADLSDEIIDRLIDGIDELDQMIEVADRTAPAERPTVRLREREFTVSLTDRRSAHRWFINSESEIEELRSALDSGRPLAELRRAVRLLARTSLSHLMCTGCGKILATSEAPEWQCIHCAGLVREFVQVEPLLALVAEPVPEGGA